MLDSWAAITHQPRVQPCGNEEGTEGHLPRYERAREGCTRNGGMEERQLICEQAQASTLRLLCGVGLTPGHRFNLQLLLTSINHFRLGQVFALLKNTAAKLRPGTPGPSCSSGGECWHQRSHVQSTVRGCPGERRWLIAGTGRTGVHWKSLPIQKTIG